MKKFYLILIVLFFYNLSWGQTTLISPTGDGGFENGITYAANGWTVVNGSTNQYYVGSAPTTYAGSNCAFTGSNSTTWSGTANANVNHMYRSVSFPSSGENVIVLAFKYKINNVDATYDFLKVWLTSSTPVAGTQLTSTQIGTTYDAATSWTDVTIIIPGSYAGATTNLVFSWKTDGTSPNAALAIDNISLISQPPLSGTKTIKSSGGDYANFTDAINALNGLGVGAGGVTFNVDAGFTSTELLPIITATGTASNPIIFQKSGAGTNPLITAGTGTGTTDGIIRILGGDYITFDGIDVQENASNTTTNTQMEYGFYIYNATSTNGAQYNTIKNSKITLNRTNTNSKGIYQYTATSATNATGANSYNKYQGNTVENSYQGIYCQGTSTTYPDINMEISSCIVGGSTANDIGNGTTTLSGIYVTNANSLSLFTNEVRNVTTTSSVVVNGVYLLAINGISNIYNNKIHDINSTSTSTSSVIYGLRTEVASGAACNVYNNMLYGFNHGITTASGTQVIRVIAGNVTSTYTGTNNYYYNSVRLDENQYPSSTIFYMYYGTANLKNNVFANYSTFGATSFRYCIYKAGGTIGTSNYNDFYINNGSTNCHVGYSTSNQNTLANWQSATSKDANSKNVDPNFTSSTDLHVFSADLNAAGVTISTVNGDAINITTDYDGDTRTSTPDIGADEFNIDCTGAVGGSANGTTSNCGSFIPTITAIGYSIGTGSTYQWQSSTDNFVSNITDISGQTNPASLTTGTVSTTTYYRLKVSCNAGTATDYSTVVTITIKSVPTASAGSNTPVCTGNTLNLTGTTDIGTSFNWSGPNGFTSTNQNPTITNTTTANSGTYTFTATYDGCTSANAITNVVIGIMPGEVIVSPVSQTIYAGQIETLVASGGNIDAGNGTIGTAANNSNIVNPYKISNKSTRTHIIFTAAELTAIGATANIPIYSISFTIPTGNSYSYTINNFSISMKNTTTSKFTSATAEPFESGATQVFSPADVSIPITTTSTYDITHILNTPFYWDGTSNLLIETCLSNNTFGGTNANIRTTALLSNPMVHNISDNTDACTISSGGSINSYRPILKIAFQQPINKTWSPVTGLYTDASATIAYTGNAINTVYAKPIVTTTYTAAANSNGCASSYNSVITVTPTWLGTTNTNWSDASNWNYNIPALSDDITIPSFATNQPHITTTNAVCNNLTINSGASLTIASGKALTVNGTLTNNAGNSGLLIKSDATGTGSLITSSIVNGTVERYIAKDNTWHFLSSPVAAQVIKPNFAPTVADATFDFFKWDESDASYIAPWINIRNTNGTYATGFDNFETGKGYLVAYSSSYTGNATHEFTGNLNNGDQSISISNSGNTFNLIGNPFASAIDWNASGYTNRDDNVLKNTTPSIFVWNSADGNYGVYNSTIGTGTHSVSNIIPPHQGFFVEAKTSGTFTIPNTARVHPGAQNFLKSTPSNLLRLKVNSNANTYSDEVIVNFNSNATANDGVAKWFSMITEAPSLYSVKNSKNFSINTLTAINADLVVHVSFKAGVNGNYSIKASELASFSNLSNLILKDLQTGITQNLLQNPVYNFASSTTDNANRFQLIFNSTSGISNLSNNSSVIYLADNQIQIQSNNQIERLEIYNAIGQLIYQSNTKSNQLSVNVSDFTRGTYIVRLIANQKIQTQKLIINN